MTSIDNKEGRISVLVTFSNWVFGEDVYIKNNDHNVEVHQQYGNDFV